MLFTQEVYQINGDLKDEGIRKRKNHNRYCFFASDELRSLYDTDEIVGAIDIYDKMGITRKERKEMELDYFDKK